jgi:alkanesulfonate monooxygenase SsuD/methylene tetrahydromethanopterin reductase-like flavin-dependent oxidoreductase (luciferase family)
LVLAHRNAPRSELTASRPQYVDAVVAIDVQLAATHADWPTLREASVRAEAAGFDAIWVFDHIAGVSLGGHSSLECFTWLGALAEATSSVELGVMVANTWNRQVGTLAVAAASVSAISGRPFMLGVGAGAAPSSKWASEQHIARAQLEERIDVRHARVEELLDLTDEMWHANRDDAYATFPRPTPTPPRIVGVNSVALSTIAGRRAEGINVAWNHPRRDEFLGAARDAAAGRPLLTTAWTMWSPGLTDPDHPTRREMDAAGLDRIILVVIDDVEAFAGQL